jgi:thymidine phosphorylase
MADVTDNDEVMGVLNDWVNGSIDDEEAQAHLIMAVSAGELDAEDYTELLDEMEIDY